MTRRITAAVVLPSGVESGDFSICVAPGGMSLEITVEWPEPLVDLTIMHRKWLSGGSTGDFQVFHPKYTGFEHALKNVRDRSSDTVVSVARIPLPFPVQTHIDSKFNLAWRESSTKMVYIEMKAFAEQYSVVNDEDEFEVL